MDITLKEIRKIIPYFQRIIIEVMCKDVDGTLVHGLYYNADKFENVPVDYYGWDYKVTNIMSVVKEDRNSFIIISIMDDGKN